MTTPMQSVSADAHTHGAPHPLPAGFKPVFRVREFELAFGVGHTKVYELINDGEIEAVKIGSATGITGESAFAWLARQQRIEPKKAA